MIRKIIGRAFVHRALSVTMELLRRLRRGLFLLAFVAEMTATSSGSFAQSLGAAGVQSARDPPYRAIGQVVGPIPCTGAIVLHPRIVLTAADCVVGRVRLGRTVSFRLAYQVGQSSNAYEGHVAAVGSIRQRQAQSIYDASQDWAIILLDKRPPGIRPLDVASYTLQKLQAMRGRILLPSYSRGLVQGQALSVDPSCSIEGVKWEVLVHNCSAGVGALGAPLIVRDEDCYSVVGIHSGTMLVEDRENHMQLAGHSAIAAWNFVDRLHKVLGRLNVEEGINDTPMPSSNTCSSGMILSRFGPPPTSL